MGFVLFSTKGRINRKQFWLAMLSLWTISCVGIVLSNLATPAEGLAILLVATILTLYPTLAVCIKRFHDMDESSWLVIFLFIPLINLISVLLLGTMHGTAGPNRYGPSPA